MASQLFRTRQNNDKRSVLPNYFVIYTLPTLMLFVLHQTGHIRCLNYIATRIGIIGAKCEKELIAIPKISHFYGNDECIYNVSCPDLQFWLKMVSKLLCMLL